MKLHVVLLCMYVISSRSYDDNNNGISSVLLYASNLILLYI